MSNFKAVALAAGASTRMKSDVPKFLHKIAGKTLVEYVVGTAIDAGAECAVVVGNQSEQVKKVIEDKAQFFTQDLSTGYGTGHAVMAAGDFFAGYDGTVVVLFGADPLITTETILSLVETHEKEGNAFTIVSVVMDDPLSYGRIVRKDGKFAHIVENKDATPEEKLIKEINTGVCAFNAAELYKALKSLKNDNAKGEYYLTDVPRIMLESGLQGGLLVAQSFDEFHGVDTRIDLATATKVMRKRINERHMLNGVTIIDPENTYIDYDVEIGQDTEIYPSTYIHGKTVIGSHCKIGPFAYIRPGSKIGDNVKVGDFVEIKNAVVGDGSKISHLAYVGDCDMGKDVNFSCGAIISNYDGKKKYRTTINDGAFVGCNSNLVSPVVIGEGAYVAAGSTITKDVPSNTLAIARERQVIKDNWKDKRD